MFHRALRSIWHRLTRVDAIKDAHKISKEMATRPFSDKHDENWGGGGYGAASPGQSSYRRGVDPIVREIENRPPASKHPRSTANRPTEIT